MKHVKVYGIRWKIVMNKFTDSLSKINTNALTSCLFPFDRQSTMFAHRGLISQKMMSKLIKQGEKHEDNTLAQYGRRQYYTL
jgi:hypothetical protein